MAKPPKPPPPNLNVAALSWTAAKLLKNIDSGERGASTGVVLTFSGAYLLLATYYASDCRSAAAVIS